MLKGVNKTVIEINCTDHGYFERAILFINPEQGHTSQKRLYAEAEKYIDLLGSDIEKLDFPVLKKTKNKNYKTLFLLSGMIFALVGGLFLVFNIL